MVAISLYRGNLHRVSDAPRRWPLPPQAISLHQFKALIRKRSEALSRLATALAAAASAAAPDVKIEVKVKEEDNGGEGDRCEPNSCLDSSVQNPQSSNSQHDGKEHAAEHDHFQEPRASAASLNVLAGVSSAREEEVRDTKPDVSDKTGGHPEEMKNNSNAPNDEDERKQELEKKLHALNEKKHNLVQMLKQILNAEEEIKRRCMQSPVLRPSFPQKAETTLEMGAAKQVPKLTVEVNFGNDSGGESDIPAYHNNYVGQLHHVHGTSPSATSLTRTSFSSFQHNPGLQNARTSSLPAVGHGPTTPSSLMGGAMASPSRFAPAGHQGQNTGILPAAALLPNHFITSSPSPAASAGASSVFMDPRVTNSS